MWKRTGPWRRRPAAGRAAEAALAAAALTLLLAGPAQAAGGDLAVDGQWMRALPGTLPAAGYFTIHNAGDTARALVKASSPACGTLMLHQSRSEGGMERMAHVEKVTVPANGQVAFAPGGYHLMCMSPDKAAVHPGGSVPVTLTFGDGASITADFPVRGPRGK